MVKIDDDIPLDKAALVGCGVTTGLGTASYAAEVKRRRHGRRDRHRRRRHQRGAGRTHRRRHTDHRDRPVEFNREQAGEFGATHMFASAEEALEPIGG